MGSAKSDRLDPIRAAHTQAPPSTPADAQAPAPDAPKPSEACLYGLVGDVARAGSEDNETNPIAIAGHFMAYLSCALGRRAYLDVGNTRHHPRLFFLHVGRSGRGRKGDALSLVMRIDEAIRARDPTLAPQIHRGGLSSREGLAALIHDGYFQGRREIPPITDKRLWVIESEFSNVLMQCRRGGNTLSAALRDCWDGVDLKPATKSNRVFASDPHVCLSGAITPSELQALMQAREFHNGFANRFLFAWAERSQIQPFPKKTPQTLVLSLADRVTEVLQFAAASQEKSAAVSIAMFMSRDARLLYGHLYREEFGAEDDNPLIASLLERQAPTLLRLAMLLALTDMQEQIDEDHVEAALAWIRHASESVRHVFAAARTEADVIQAQLIAEKIKAYLDRHGSATRSQLIVDCFQRHQPVATIDAGLAHLRNSLPARFCVDLHPKQPGEGGRSTTIYRLI